MNAKKATFWITAVAGLLLTPGVMSAQAPAGATGQCKDGTYTTTATKQGACRGHKGVGTWLAAPSTPAAKTAAAPAPSAVTTTTPTPAPAPVKAATTTKTATSTTPAPGGGPGMVWVNTASNVYHCSGTKYYGTTKAGKYMTEAQAKSAGARADHNQPCTK